MICVSVKCLEQCGQIDDDIGVKWTMIKIETDRIELIVWLDCLKLMNECTVEGSIN